MSSSRSSTKCWTRRRRGGGSSAASRSGRLRSLPGTRGRDNIVVELPVSILHESRKLRARVVRQPREHEILHVLSHNRVCIWMIHGVVCCVYRSAAHSREDHAGHPFVGQITTHVARC